MMTIEQIVSTQLHTIIGSTFLEQPSACKIEVSATFPRSRSHQSLAGKWRGISTHLRECRNQKCTQLVRAYSITINRSISVEVCVQVGRSTFFCRTCQHYTWARVLCRFAMVHALRSTRDEAWRSYEQIGMRMDILRPTVIRRHLLYHAWKVTRASLNEQRNSPSLQGQI
jgi:hypothetical protein